MIDRLNAALDGRYHLVRELGRGGMATVYLAEDVKHDRNVALKVLKPELAAVVGGDRFLTEIKTTANLSHPNILPLFDSGEADSFLFYVMPYMEGETLGDRLGREKQLAVANAVRIIGEVAEALDHAHQQGVVHRDVKPANILLQAGRPLVADFGIALAVSQAGGGRLTETGLSMGTPHYMSPEQASGDRDVDPRTDVYSLGCVLFEMLTGEPPYGGGTAQAVLARILTAKPDRPTAIRSTIPRHVEAVILKSMEKLPADRFESAGEFAKALKDESFRYGEEAVGGAVHGGRWRTAAIGAAAMAVSLPLLAFFAGRPPLPEPPPTLRVAFSMVPGQEILDAQHNILSFSHDGSVLVYQGPSPTGSQLWVKDRNRLEARPLPGTEGAQNPEVDPTGQWVAFLDGSQLKKMPLSGGPAVVLGDAATSDVGAVAWLDDGSIVYSIQPGWAPRRVPAEGGEGLPVDILLSPGFEGSLGYSALPGGGFLYTVCQNFCQTSAALWGYQADLGPVEIAADVLAGWYVETGHVVFVHRNGSVFVAELDPSTLTLGGAPIPLFDGVKIDAGAIPDMEVSRSGTLLVQMGEAQQFEHQLVWIDREGRKSVADSTFAFLPGPFSAVRLSPDDRLVAFAQRAESGSDIWVKELDEGPAYRLTFDATPEFRPEWSPGGESILFVSERLGQRDLFSRSANATSSTELILDAERPISQGLWSADSVWVIYRDGLEDGRDISGYRPGLDSIPVPLLNDPGYHEKAPALSPDGRWIAYESDESGRDEVYIRPFPNTEEGKWQVSVGGGQEPAWAHSGRELFYIRDDDVFVAAQVDPGPPFRVGRRSELFSLAATARPSQSHATYDVTRDDQRFLFELPRSLSSGKAMYWVLVENWGTELARLSREGRR